MATTFNDRVELFCRRLADRRVDGSLAAAKGTAELLRQLIASSRLSTPDIMLAEVKKLGLRIQAAKPIGAGLCRRRRAALCACWIIRGGLCCCRSASSAGWQAVLCIAMQCNHLVPAGLPPGPQSW